MLEHKLDLEKRKSQEFLKHCKMCNLIFVSFYKSPIVSARFKELLQYNQPKSTPIGHCMKQNRGSLTIKTILLECCHANLSKSDDGKKNFFISLKSFYRSAKTQNTQDLVNIRQIWGMKELCRCSPLFSANRSCVLLFVEFILCFFPISSIVFKSAM